MKGYIGIANDDWCSHLQSSKSPCAVFWRKKAVFKALQKGEYFFFLNRKAIQLNQESYNKYMYALKLREDAAGHIGIENIRRSRLEKLAREKASIEVKYEKGSQIYPDFRLMILVRLEA